MLPTGSVRAHRARPGLARCPAIAEGAWWVQDAAAALPARLLGDVAGKRVADLCAAPGGKTAQLAAAGAHVTAVDRSPARLARLRENLARLQLTAEIVAADAAEWQAGPFDAVLLDAPCSSTGTIRRHPDMPWLKREADIATLAALQRRLLDRAVDADQARRHASSIAPARSSPRRARPDRGLLAREPERAPAPDRRPTRSTAKAEWLTAATATCAPCPAIWPDPDPRMAGLDGFYAARLVNGDT